MSTEHEIQQSTLRQKKVPFIGLAIGGVGKFLEVKGYLPPNTTEQFVSTLDVSGKTRMEKAEHDAGDIDFTLNSFLDLANVLYSNVEEDNAEKVEERSVNITEKYKHFLKQLTNSRKAEIDETGQINNEDLNLRTKVAWMRTRVALNMLDQSYASGVELRRAYGESKSTKDTLEHKGVVGTLKGVGTKAAIGIHTYVEDAMLASIAVETHALISRVPLLELVPTSAELLTLLSTYALTYGENNIFTRIALKNTDTSTIRNTTNIHSNPEDQYLTASLTKKILKKDSAEVRTMVVGAPLGALLDTDSLLQKGQEKLTSDQIQKLAHKHAKSFAQIVVAINGTILALGNAGEAGGKMLDVVFSPPVFGSILIYLFGSRNQKELFQDYRTEPTLPMKAANRISASFNRVFKKEKDGDYVLAAVAEDKPKRVDPPAIPPTEDVEIAQAD